MGTGNGLKPLAGEFKDRKKATETELRDKLLGVDADAILMSVAKRPAIFKRSCQKPAWGVAKVVSDAMDIWLRRFWGVVGGIVFVFDGKRNLAKDTSEQGQTRKRNKKAAEKDLADFVAEKPLPELATDEAKQKQHLKKLAQLQKKANLPNDDLRAALIAWATSCDVKRAARLCQLPEGLRHVGVYLGQWIVDAGYPTIASLQGCCLEACKRETAV